MEDFLDFLGVFGSSGWRLVLILGRCRLWWVGLLSEVAGGVCGVTDGRDAGMSQTNRMSSVGLMHGHTPEGCMDGEGGGEGTYHSDLGRTNID